MRATELKESGLDQLIAQAEAEPAKPGVAGSVAGAVKKTASGIGGLGASIAKGVATGLQGAGGSVKSYYTPIDAAKEQPVAQQGQVDPTASVLKKAAGQQPVEPTGNQGLDQLLKNAGLLG